MGGQYIVKWRIGRRVFAPSLFFTALTVLLLGVFVRLGFWQLDRAEQKHLLMQQAQDGSRHTQAYDPARAEHWPRYQRVQLQGHYDTAHQILLDNMPSSQGQPGYRVLTPLHLDDQHMVLVDRGWIPWGPGREPLASVMVNDAPRRVVGLLDELPAPGHRAGDAGIKPANNPDSWPQVLNFPRYDELKLLYSQPLAPRIVLLDAAQPDGYERGWKVLNEGFVPERHVAYAVQWFGFAVTLLIIFVVVNLKRIEVNHD